MVSVPLPTAVMVPVATPRPLAAAVPGEGQGAWPPAKPPLPPWRLPRPPWPVPPLAFAAEAVVVVAATALVSP